jgi:EpsI family protein
VIAPLLHLRPPSNEATAPPHAATIAALALVLAAYATSWRRFPSVWMDNRSYGMLAAGLCFWLLWQKRQRFVYEHHGIDPGLTLLSAALSLGWFAATVVNVQVVHLAVLPMILLAWTGAVFGLGALRLAQPVALIFFLAVPVWELLNGPLQWMTAVVNGLLVKAVSLSAVVEGNQIRFPFGTIEVAESCSGLSYFMTALTIATVYGQTMLRHPRARLVAIAVAVSLAVVGNWLRVFGLVLIGSSTRMQSPLMNEHATYGWVIFCATMLGFFAVTRRLERFDVGLGTTERRAADSEAVGSVTGPHLQARRQLVVATAVSLIGPIVYFSLQAFPAAPASEGPAVGIRADASWTPGAPSVESAGAPWWVPDYRGAAKRQTVWYARGTEHVQVDRFIYAVQSQGAELVSSENRIASVPNTLAERTVGPLDDQLRIVSEATVRTPDGVRLVWYWYRVAGFETSDPAKAKLLELVAFVGRGPPSELIAASTPCGPSDCREASTTLFAVVAGRPIPR